MMRDDEAQSFAHLEIAWRPDETLRTGSVLGRFLAAEGLPDVAALSARAAQDPEWFWDATLRQLGIAFQTPYREVLDLTRGREFPLWFRGGHFNVAHAGVDVHAAGSAASRMALAWEGEDGATRRLSFAELKTAVDEIAGGLRAIGIGQGDAIGVYLPMLPETMVIAYAAAKIGAILVPTFSGYGPEAVATRLRDAGAKLLVTADGFLRRGKPIAMKEAADEAARLAPSVEHVLVVRRLGREAP